MQKPNKEDFFIENEGEKIFNHTGYEFVKDKWKKHSLDGWISVSEQLPPCDEVVNTKIFDEENGERNIQQLKQMTGTGRHWWFPDGSMYVYYTPTHWQPIKKQQPMKREDFETLDKYVEWLEERLNNQEQTIDGFQNGLSEMFGLDKNEVAFFGDFKKLYNKQSYSAVNVEDEILANNAKAEYIICAAIHFNDGKKHLHQPRNITEGFVICGRRHHNCFTIAALLNGGSVTSYMSEVNGKLIQGFFTSKDIFVTRKEAGKIAFEQKQISKQTDCLFSEDLY